MTLSDRRQHNWRQSATRLKARPRHYVEAVLVQPARVEHGERDFLGEILVHHDCFPYSESCS